MTGDNYGAAYAAVYDHLYAEKDYGTECNLIEASFKRFAPLPVESILDLGCGTGEHALLLANHGYRVTAVDRSDQMLEIAKGKSSVSPGRIRWVKADVRDMNLGERFDAAIMMFAVLGYFIADDEVVAALTNIRHHLWKEGLLCFDFWYAPAVLAIGTSDRVKTVSWANGHLARHVSATLFPRQRTCHVDYQLEGQLGSVHRLDSRETHVVRYFSAEEIRGLLGAAGFDLVSLTAFPSLDRAADESTWNAYCVARAN